MILLLLSCAALCSGPAILAWIDHHHRAVRWVDYLVIASILPLVLFHIIPESIEHAHWMAAIGIGIGLGWPFLYQKLTHSRSCQLQRSLLSLASIGVLTHTFLDGVALADNAYLGAAVVLHRIPEGFGIWRIAEAAFSRTWGLAMLGVITLTTTLGYLFGTTWVLYASDGFIGIFEGLMAGVLLHVVFHQSQHTLRH
ncbi:MAG: hypothetical protein I8H75_02880 [Myxococcaceae bacterium]|nr:hypothetical protein [Myxococcaceae bacterium]MBH2006275.1 hypothetical protein [Myxococcaceae bacterium]